MGTYVVDEKGIGSGLGRTVHHALKKSVVIENRAARHNYFVEDTLECGIYLRGNEVKSIRCGMASIKEAWIDITDGQMVIKQMHITKWDTSNLHDVDTTRERVLLAHKREISKLFNLIKRDGYTLVPLKVYFNERGKCKVLVGVCKGKKLYDKRESAKQADAKRNMQRALKNS